MLRPLYAQDKTFRRLLVGYLFGPQSRSGRGDEEKMSARYFWNILLFSSVEKTIQNLHR
jgi:hypothetical protein